MPGCAPARAERVAWFDLVREVWAAPNGAAALGTVWRYILLIHGEPPEVVLAQLAAVTPDARRVQEDVMTAGEVLIERGRVEGELKGQRHALLTVLAARFGAVPEATAAKVNAATQAQIDAWLRRSVIARSLDDVFAG